MRRWHVHSGARATRSAWTLGRSTLNYTNVANDPATQFHRKNHPNPAMTTIPEDHRRTAPAIVPCAVVTVSDTRTAKTDSGGAAVVDHLTTAGHRVVDRQIVRENPAEIRALLASLVSRDDLQAILLTGGTGLSARDQTYEIVTAFFTKTIPGYGELFRMLSYAEIGSAAMLSRATAGLIGRTLVLTMPGSPAAVRLAMEKLIIPELPHLVREARR
jgi:molybdenum cofactor biosynthesis protein B